MTTTPRTNPAVLFVCTGNAGRSQIAEELYRRAGPSDRRVASAGVAPWDQVHPVATRLLAEQGIDISKKPPRSVRDVLEESFDLVVTIGDRARDETPDFPGLPVRVHWDLPDPADADGTPHSERVFRSALAAIEEQLPGLRQTLARIPPWLPPFAAGISTCIVRPNGFHPPDHLPLIARAGFPYIELNCHAGQTDFPWWSAAAVRELAQISDGEGVRIPSVHAPGRGGHAPAGRPAPAYAETLSHFCDICLELGARVLVMHPFGPRELAAAEAESIITRELDALVEHVLPLPLILGLENLPWTTRPAEELDRVRAYPNSATGFVLDNGHARMAPAQTNYLAGCGRRLCSLHLQDSDGQHDSHWLPGAGTEDWARFIEQLAATGYTGPLMLEAEARDRQAELPQVLTDCADSVAMLRALVPDGQREQL
ncbi:TIM barrel protein [bacterium]|nr:TIM barrel protein [bacterium]